MSEFPTTVIIGDTSIPYGITNLRFGTAAPGDSSTCGFVVSSQTIGSMAELSSILHWGADLTISGGPGQKLWRGIISSITPDQRAGNINVQGIGYWSEAKDVLFQYSHTQTGYADWVAGFPYVAPGYSGPNWTFDAFRVFSNKFQNDKYSRLYITSGLDFAYSAGEGFFWSLKLAPGFAGQTFTGHYKYNLNSTTDHIRIHAIHHDFTISDLYSANGVATGDTDFSYTIPEGTSYICIRYYKDAFTAAQLMGVNYFMVTVPKVIYTTVGSHVDDIVKDLASTLGGQLGWSTTTTHIDTNSTVVDSLMFDQPLSLPEMFETLNAYVDYDYGLTTDKIFYWRTKDTSRIAARISADFALEDNLQWNFTDLYNEVFVRYTDSDQRETYLFIENTDPTNYLNQWSKRRTAAIWMSDSQSDTEAENTGNAYLDAHNYAKPNGTLALNLADYFYLRAGMFVEYLGGPYGQQVLMIQETDIDVDAGTITLTLTDLPGGPRTVLRRRRIQRWHKLGTD